MNGFFVILETTARKRGSIPVGVIFRSVNLIEKMGRRE